MLESTFRYSPNLSPATSSHRISRTGLQALSASLSASCSRRCRTPRTSLPRWSCVLVPAPQERKFRALPLALPLAKGLWLCLAFGFLPSLMEALQGQVQKTCRRVRGREDSEAKVPRDPPEALSFWARGTSKTDRRRQTKATTASSTCVAPPSPRPPRCVPSSCATRMITNARCKALRRTSK